MPQRELECSDCGSILDIYTPPENWSENLICPNCAGTKMFEIAYTADVDLELAKAFLNCKPVNKKKH